MLKPLRIFRLFKRVPQLRRLTSTIVRAVPGVTNALFLYFSVMSMFAIWAVQMYVGAGVFAVC